MKLENSADWTRRSQPSGYSACNATFARSLRERGNRVTPFDAEDELTGSGPAENGRRHRTAKRNQSSQRSGQSPPPGPAAQRGAVVRLALVRVPSAGNLPLRDAFVRAACRVDAAVVRPGDPEPAASG